MRDAVAPTLRVSRAVDEVLHERRLGTGLELDHDARLGSDSPRGADENEMDRRAHDDAGAHAEPEAASRECRVQRRQRILRSADGFRERGDELVPVRFWARNLDVGERACAEILDALAI